MPSFLALSTLVLLPGVLSQIITPGPALPHLKRNQLSDYESCLTGDACSDLTNIASDCATEAFQTTDYNAMQSCLCTHDYADAVSSCDACLLSNNPQATQYLTGLGQYTSLVCNGAAAPTGDSTTTGASSQQTGGSGGNSSSPSTTPDAANNVGVASEQRWLATLGLGMSAILMLWRW
jgi:hypothetical protein